MFSSVIVCFTLFYHSDTTAYDPNDCHFGRSYNADELFNSTDLQEEFLLRASHWQGVFGRNALGTRGPISLFGITYDFTANKPSLISPMLDNDETFNSFAFSEAIHLALLASALDGDIYAREFFTSSKNAPAEPVEDYIVQTLNEKMNLYIKFVEEYPGYGGFIPKFDIYRQTSIVPTNVSVISPEDHAEFCWAMIAVSQVLNETGYPELYNNYMTYINIMADSALTMFFHVPNKKTKRQQILREVEILDPKASVTKSNYAPSLACSKNPYPCDLSIYQKAEPFTLFVYLYANWTELGSEAQTIRNGVFSGRRSFIEPACYLYKNRCITVERRKYFLADELLHYLFLPYLDIPICERLFLNAELVRTLYSNSRRYPGLFGQAFMASTPDDLNLYDAHPGIPELSYVQPSSHDVVMPHSAFPLLMHSDCRSYGIVWYATMLNSTKSQTSLGAVETITMNGNMTSRSIKWLAGPMSVLAFGGRLSKITKRYLMANQKYDDFYALFEQMYIEIFGNRTPYESRIIPFALPSNVLPMVGNYSQCNFRE